MDGRFPAEFAALWNQQEPRPVGYDRVRRCLPVNRTEASLDGLRRPLADYEQANLSPPGRETVHNPPPNPSSLTSTNDTASATGQEESGGHLDTLLGSIPKPWHARCYRTTTHQAASRTCETTCRSSPARIENGGTSAAPTTDRHERLVKGIELTRKER